MEPAAVRDILNKAADAATADIAGGYANPAGDQHRLAVQRAIKPLMRERMLNALVPVGHLDAALDGASNFGKPFYNELHRVVKAFHGADNQRLVYLRTELGLAPLPVGILAAGNALESKEINQTVEALAKLSPAEFKAKYTAARVAAGGGLGGVIPVFPNNLRDAHKNLYDYNQRETSKLMSAWNKRQAKVNPLQIQLNYMRAYRNAVTNNLPLPVKPPLAVPPLQNGTYSPQQIQQIEGQLSQAKKFEKINGPLGGYWMRSKKMSWELNLTVIRPIKLNYIPLGVNKLICAVMKNILIFARFGAVRCMWSQKSRCN